MKIKVETIPELKRIKGIKNKDISKLVAIQTYYNVIEGTYTPTAHTKAKLAKLFGVSMPVFNKLITNTIKKFNS